MKKVVRNFANISTIEKQTLLHIYKFNATHGETVCCLAKK
jgi:hypothetical protein